MKVNTAVFIAAGIGSRLKECFDSRPKGFLPVGSQPIIERSINILLSNGIERILIGTGYKSEFYDELTEKYSQIECVKNVDYEKSGSFYTLYNMKNYVEDDFILLESDLLYEERAVTLLLNDDRKNIIIASDWTKSGDEFFIEVDEENNLAMMSKNKYELKNTYGELVGISKISYSLFKELCKWAQANIESAFTRDYEYAFNCIAETIPIAIKKIEGLLWVEIDDKAHLQRAHDTVYPRIREKENA